MALRPGPSPDTSQPVWGCSTRAVQSSPGSSSALMPLLKDASTIFTALTSAPSYTCCSSGSGFREIPNCNISSSAFQGLSPKAVKTASYKAKKYCILVGGSLGGSNEAHSIITWTRVAQLKALVWIWNVPTWSRPQTNQLSSSHAGPWVA